MKAKLKVEITVRIDEKDDFSVSDLRDIVRKYVKDGKYVFNNINFISNYQNEEAKTK
tara:strand:+ start:124 stop:294 length:171 start_codon:yes stop_codon:yes gene_type:complete